jgi:DNA-binding IclR family transcriptional regulator
VFDHSDGAVAALTVPYLKQRDVKVSLAAARQTLLATVRRISAGLGAPAARG